MSSAPVELTFAAQFASAAVATAGLLLLALRRRRTTGAASVVPAPLAGRVALAAGLLAVAAAGAGDGLALLGHPLVDGLRAIGGVAVTVSGASWRRARTEAALAALGGSAWAAAGVVGLVGGAPPSVVPAVLLGGAAAVVVALLGASRSAVAARVAGAAAAALVVVVVVLSVALGSEITSSLQKAELASVTGRAGVEAAALPQEAAVAVEDARFAGADLVASTDADALLSGSGARIAPRLDRLSALYPVGGFAYAGPAGTVVAVSGQLDAADAAELLDVPGVVTAGCGGGGGVAVAGGGMWAVGAFPECIGARVVGEVLRATPLGHSYLSARAGADPATTLALLTASDVATSGAAVDPALVALGRTTSGASDRVQGELAVAVQPVTGPDGSRVGSLVVAAPLATQVAARTSLLHALFLVSAGGTILVLLLAALVGDRITAGLRRLTDAAARVQAGDTTARAGLGGDDEVAALGGAFDDMVIAIEDQTLALERAAADEARLRDRLEAVVAGMGDALVAVDPSGLVTDFNPAAVGLTGIRAADALGHPLASLLELRSDDGAAIDLAGPAATTTVGVLVGAGGAVVPVAASIGPLAGELGSSAGAVVVLRDLRREHEVERMKSEFLSRIGHELRTPLTGILGYAQLLARFGDDVPPGRGPQFSAEILTSARRLLRIVEMLEFVAGSGAGRVTLRREPVDVGAIVSGAVESWSAKLPGGAISRRVGRRLPSVAGDRRWLALAVDELIDNAVKFSPEGAHIDVRASAGDGAVHVVVRDRGKGMTDEEQAAAFTDFAQGDSSDTRSYGGLGLGLGIVARVVDGLGGSVACSSRPGRGTTITLTLPAAGADTA